jgi:hypothetical protein
VGRACNTNGGQRELGVGFLCESVKIKPLRRPVLDVRIILKCILNRMRCNVLDLAQDKDQWRAVASTVTKLRVPQNVGEFLISCTTSCF